VFDTPFRRVESGSASIVLALAGMLPASFNRVDFVTAAERFHLSKHYKVNESDYAETEEERVGLKIADLD
jgi:hypothetical protein